MKLAFQVPSGRLSEKGLLVVFATEGSRPELPAGVRLPPSALRDFKGAFRELRPVDPLGGGARRVLLIGLGKERDVDLEKLRRAAAVAVQQAEQMAYPSATLLAPRAPEKLAGGGEAVGFALAEGAWMGRYRFDAAKSKPKPLRLKAVRIVGRADVGRGVRRGRVLAEANCFVRDLQNAPGNQMTPRDLAAAARSLARRGKRITCRVHDERALERMGLGLLLGVAQGSSQPPRLIHLTYRPRAKAAKRVALIGKGLTFDAGGISIKPAAKMDEMRYDMSGGGAVLGVFHALASLDVPVEVHGIVPSTENVISGSATKPGDIFTAYDGTTVEVLNTDAEGRLILADALAYAVDRVAPDVIVDLATLTGAVVVALGHELSGLFATSTELRDALVAAGDATGERLWPLPLLDHHKEQMKGAFADLKNIASGDMGAGSSAGAAFLAHFAGETEWAHLDIAGTAWGGSNRDWVGGSQGSGVGTRLLVAYLESIRVANGARRRRVPAAPRSVGRNRASRAPRSRRR